MNTLIFIALLSTNGVELSWDSIPGSHYQIMSTSSLRPPIVWTTIENILATNSEVLFKVSNSTREKYINVVLRTNLLYGGKLHLEPNTRARQQADEWQGTRPDDAREMLKIADTPTSVWITSQGQVSKIGEVFGRSSNSIPVFVLYNIFERDYQSGFSGGGALSPTAYTNFINSCRAILTNTCAVILEPDALAALDGLPLVNQSTRISLMRYAVDRLSELQHVAVYVDAGHPRWKDVATMALRLRQIGVSKTKGFALNVSNFITTSECTAYGTSLSRELGYIHFIIDTSRNGRGPAPDYAWCNPPGRGLGKLPTGKTENPLIDAYLWVKYPGESDGTCNGGPPAGEWFPEYALELAGNSEF